MFKLSCLSFSVPYWYVLLLDKTSWNNHSYLYGLLSILLLFSSANHTGMFPYVCLATLPVFCDADWSKRWIARCHGLLRKCLPDATRKITYVADDSPAAVAGVEKRGKNSTFKITLVGLYVVTQLALPWSHSVTQGYNNWTNGLYGYSWDMMVHAWETMHVVVTVKDKTTGRINYLDTEVFVRNDKWVGHADMASIYQYAHCVKDRLGAVNMTDVAIYVDVWRSLYGRFQQRLIDPRVNLLETEWSPFRPTRWLMPLLTELSAWRQKLNQLERTVFNWSYESRVAFVADFPGLSMDNYVPASVTNATIQVLEGQVELSIENSR
uniref:Uncharacterized protein n=1 Tax=Daphnia galeata TaxID=27404 RepID=A0A8J2RU94_9CRUS|nr:unnamed protein product [Daphnia galeata]